MKKALLALFVLLKIICFSQPTEKYLDTTYKYRLAPIAPMTQNTYKVDFGNGPATAFCVQFQGITYFITAKHVIGQRVKNSEMKRAILYFKGGERVLKDDAKVYLHPIDTVD